MTAADNTEDFDAKTKRLIIAAQAVLDGLHERIENAPEDKIPVFAGISELCSALADIRGEQDTEWLNAPPVGKEII